jgi:hypothetical protein
MKDYFFSGKFLECKRIKFFFLNNFLYIFRFLRYVSSLEKRYYTEDLHCKKRTMIFPSPAKMSLSTSWNLFWVGDSGSLGGKYVILKNEADICHLVFSSHAECAQFFPHAECVLKSRQSFETSSIRNNRRVSLYSSLRVLSMDVSVLQQPVLPPLMCLL